MFRSAPQQHSVAGDSGYKVGVMSDLWVHLCCASFLFCLWPGFVFHFVVAIRYKSD